MPFPTPFLRDYLEMNAGNECPENYHIWSALCLLSAVVSRKVYLDRRAYILRPNLYCLLVGRPGTRKSTAKQIMKTLLTEHFPTWPVSSNITSREAIAKFLGKSESIRAYTDETGSMIEYHPFFIIANEMKNFLSVNPSGMLDFLTDIYDQDHFDISFKNTGEDIIPNPYIILLACETPDWLLENLKLNIFTGGFARRVVTVYELKRRCSIPNPWTDLAARSRVVDRLNVIKGLAGRMSLQPEAQEYYDSWYSKLEIPTDPLMEGFYSSKHDQLLKVAMLLTAANDGTLEIRLETIQLALAILDRVEPNMHLLFSSASRNNLAIPTARLLAALRSNGGKMSEKKFLIEGYKEMNPNECFGAIRHLERTEQITYTTETINGVARRLVVLLDPDKGLLGAVSGGSLGPLSHK